MLPDLVLLGLFQNRNSAGRRLLAQKLAGKYCISFDVWLDILGKYLLLLKRGGTNSLLPLQKCSKVLDETLDHYSHLSQDARQCEHDHRVVKYLRVHANFTETYGRDEHGDAGLIRNSLHHRKEALVGIELHEPVHEEDEDGACNEQQEDYHRTRIILACHEEYLKDHDFEVEESVADSRSDLLLQFRLEVLLDHFERLGVAILRVHLAGDCGLEDRNEVAHALRQQQQSDALVEDVLEVVDAAVPWQQERLAGLKQEVHEGYLEDEVLYARCCSGK